MESKSFSLIRMNDILTLYLYYLEELNDRNDFQLESDSKESQDEAARFVARVFKSFISLKDEEKEILNNEYFKRVGSGWWIKKYTKDEFDELLHQSINAFIRRFNSL